MGNWLRLEYGEESNMKAFTKGDVKPAGISVEERSPCALKLWCVKQKVGE